ncbi:MAG: DUF2975 domain-containing protein [Oscillospiraceae bacterium]|jgi:hypothetical protein|nr:DUF2975 domain-containing protein [Oscillospiraceae bacterium]
MKHSSTIILRLAVIAAEITILALCYGGTWAVTTAWDSNSSHHVIMTVMLGGLYLTAIPFFIAIYQAMKLLGYIDCNRAFSGLSVEALQKIKFCAIATFVVCTLGGLPAFYYWADMADAPGLMIIGMAIDGGAFVSAVLASILKRLLQDAIEVKSENDLTI